MKNTKYILGSFLLIVTLTPQITFASWWNPFTWFNKQPKTEQTTPAVSGSLTIPNNTTAPTTTPKQTVNSPKKTTKTDNQLCIEQFGLHNYSTGVKNATGGLTCLCESNYTWTGKKCVLTPPETTPALVSPPVVVAPTLPVWDVCKNIEGIQTLVPSGMYADSDNCFTLIVKTDQQKCEESFGSNSLYNGQKNTSGGLICGCKSGYNWNDAQTACVVVQVKTGYQICSEQFPNETWDGTMANGKYNCVCLTGYILNNAGTGCQIPNKPNNQQQIFQLQLQYNQLESQNTILNVQGLGYASYQSVKNRTSEQLQAWLSTSGNMTVYNANQRLVTIILQIQANTEQMNLIQSQINALQN